MGNLADTRRGVADSSGVDLRPSVVRILGPEGQVAGAGFVVSGQLIATCAHVVSAEGAPAVGPITVEFPLPRGDYSPRSC